MPDRDPTDPRGCPSRDGSAPDRRDASPADLPGAPPAGGGEQRVRRPAGRARAEVEERPERRRESRRDGRPGVGRRAGEQEAGAATEQRPTGDRRRARTLAEQREQWSEVSRWLRRNDLVEFRELLERLAQVAFGGAATVMPHLRRSRGNRYLVFVVDAACPEACTDYDEFLPLERAFWTAYATIPKPATPFVVAVRPARGWCRSEALMPLFTQIRTSEYLT